MTVLSATTRTDGSVATGAIPSLDGIRAVSILIVVVAHAGFGTVVPGGLGVTIFFFLSGYLITTLLIGEYARTDGINIPYFFARRIFRLMPPLAITLVLAYCLVAAGVLGGGLSLQGFLAQLFYFANYYVIFFHGPIPDGTGILWSLAVEEHYYILYPFLFSVIFGRLKPSATIWLLCGLCVAVLIWRIVLVVVFAVPEIRTYYATDTRIDSIMFGCIMAFAAKVPAVAPLLRSERLRLIGFWAGLALILATLLYRDPVFRETFRYTLQGIALMPIFHYAINTRDGLVFRGLNIGLVRKFGVYSYTIYLVHFVIINLLQRHVPSIAHSGFLLLLACLILSIAYAKAMDEIVDFQFRKLRSKFH